MNSENDKKSQRPLPKVKLPDPMRPGGPLAKTPVAPRRAPLSSQLPQMPDIWNKKIAKVNEDDIQMNDTIHTESSGPKARKPNKRYSMPRSRPVIGSASQTKPGTQKDLGELQPLQDMDSYSNSKRLDNF